MFLLEREMQYALYLLPYVLQVPPRKQKDINDEAAYHFIRFSPVCISFIILSSVPFGALLIALLCTVLFFVLRVGKRMCAVSSFFNDNSFQ